MLRRSKFILAAVLLAVGLVVPAMPAGASRGVTELVSVASDGTQANNASVRSSVSADGRHVAFHSAASNLVAGDTNNTADVFVHDRQTGTTERVSVASDGTQGNNSSGEPAVSADGRYVAFHSAASNLVAGDTNVAADVFVHDRVTGATERVSVAGGGTQANGYSSGASISADGRYVAFDSVASNLVAGDTNGAFDVFVHDRDTGATERVSVASDGTQANSYSSQSSISADGRHVALRSYAWNLVGADTNGHWDVFVHDRDTGTTERVSVASDGTQGNSNSGEPVVNADGARVAFHSVASNLVAGDTNGTVDVFVHDRDTGATERVSVASDGTQANSYSSQASISADGHRVAFWSVASNLVAGDTNSTYDVFVRDRVTGATERVSVASDGTQANSASSGASISADGRHVAFDSIAWNLVAGDMNNLTDVFVHGPAPLNQPPAVDAGVEGAGDEGSAITLDGTITDPDGDTVATAWSYAPAGGVDPGAACAFADPSAVDTTITCDDDGVYTVTLTAEDRTNPAVADSATVTVGNAAPAITAISGPLEPVAIDTAVNVSTVFTDAGANDSHTCHIDWGDAGTPTVVDPATSPCASGHTYTATGIYTVAVTVTDDNGGADSQRYEYVVVYDPSAGFVTGNGWIDSPPGAYTPEDSTDSDVTGTARFGFVSKYKKGAAVPDGNTRFQFRAAGLDFRSTAYEWLVVSGPKAQYKGSGTINGSGNYGFLLTVTDGQQTGGGGVDRFRIKIWDEDHGDTVIYDNQAGDGDLTAATDAIEGGRIVIHTSK